VAGADLVVAAGGMEAAVPPLEKAPLSLAAMEVVADVPTGEAE